ncbi:unnamed protein product [Dovyalis caffra]|uniref:G-type lectin S-receptor-like serine/threonine-protein kinase n=1 Tax=Dovyalis caffra TaxID=77055 RepID=A0AAV1RW63_9ROSI|nr:unnamed protein product [Dovyalis caffra]
MSDKQDSTKPTSQNNPINLQNNPLPLSPPLNPLSKEMELARAMSASSRSRLFALSRSDVLYQDQWLIAVNKPRGVYCETVLDSVPEVFDCLLSHLDSVKERGDGNNMIRERHSHGCWIRKGDFLTSFSIGGDTLLVGQSLSASLTLISQGSIFELGFFKPGSSSNIYLGIWYKNFADKLIVWVANRESPLNDPASLKLELSPDGNLALLTNFTKTVWSAAPTSSMPNSTAEAVLLDRIAGGGRTGGDIYTRLSASELELIGSGSPRIGTNKGTKKRRIRAILAVAIPVTVIALGIFIYFGCLRKRELIRKGRNVKETGPLMSYAEIPSVNKITLKSGHGRSNSAALACKQHQLWAGHCQLSLRKLLYLLRLARHVRVTNAKRLGIQRSPTDGPIAVSIGGDILLVGQSLSASQTLISQGSIFELGFFKPGSSSNIYLRIWFKDFADKKIVWVANRESPLKDPASLKLELSPDGNLVLLTNFTKTIWSTAPTSSMQASTAEAVLLDNGNFAIRDGSNPPTIYWQSFDYPTNIWLPGAKLGFNKRTGQVQRIISWKNSEDPAPGIFSAGLDPNGSSQILIESRSHRYWSTGVWNGKNFSLVPEMRSNNLFNFSYVSNENESFFIYSLNNASVLSRLVIDISGQIKQHLWLPGVWNWYLFWLQPIDQANVYGLCGAFGVFNGNSSSPCECLKGFESFVQNDWSSGCVRKSPLQCQNREGIATKDRFLKMSNLTLPANTKAYQEASDAKCRLNCMENCSCVAYAYNNSGCFLWEGALINLQQAGIAGGGRTGADIYIRLSASELQHQIGSGSPLIGTRKRVILAVVIPITVIALGLFIYFSCLRKGELIRQAALEPLPSFSWDHSRILSSEKLYCLLIVDTEYLNPKMNRNSKELGTNWNVKDRDTNDVMVITKLRKVASKLGKAFTDHNFSIGGDTLLVGQSLSASQTLISQGSIFELGFFKPGSSSKITSEYGSSLSGCVRRSPLQCQNREGLAKKNGFPKMSNLTLPANSKASQEASDARCRLDCMGNCSCVAYAYNNSGCFLWEGALINLQQARVAAGGRKGGDIYIRLAASELELQIGSGSPRMGIASSSIAAVYANESSYAKVHPGSCCNFRYSSVDVIGSVKKEKDDNADDKIYFDELFRHFSEIQ